MFVFVKKQKKKLRQMFYYIFLFKTVSYRRFQNENIVLTFKSFSVPLKIICDPKAGGDP